METAPGTFQNNKYTFENSQHFKGRPVRITLKDGSIFEAYLRELDQKDVTFFNTVTSERRKLDYAEIDHIEDAGNLFHMA